MTVRNILLPKNIENKQDYKFTLLGFLENTYWFEFIDPNFDRTTSDKVVYILSATVKQDV